MSGDIVGLWVTNCLIFGIKSISKQMIKKIATNFNNKKLPYQQSHNNKFIKSFKQYLKDSHAELVNKQDSSINMSVS